MTTSEVSSNLIALSAFILSAFSLYSNNKTSKIEKLRNDSRLLSSILRSFYFEESEEEKRGRLNELRDMLTSSPLLGNQKGEEITELLDDNATQMSTTANRATFYELQEKSRAILSGFARNL